MEVKSKSVAITTTCDYEYAKIMPNLFVFRATLTDPSGKATVTEGITNKWGLTMLGKGTVLPSFCVRLSDTMLARLHKVGYAAFLDHRAKKEYIDEMFDYIVGGGNLDNIVRINSHDHTVFHLDGRLMPTPRHFDYIQARVHNGAYDLEKAAEILVKRDDVTFLGKHNHRAMIDQVVDAPMIQEIPYYNSERGQEYYLPFLWTPSQDQAERLRADKSDGFKLIFDEDMLGLRAGGAALFDSYYKTVEIEGGDEDDCACC